MGTKKVEVWLTRGYFKQARLEIEVDESLEGTELERHIQANGEFMTQLEDKLAAASLSLEEEVFEVIE